LLPVALGALAGPREGRRAAWTTLGIGLLGAPALNPPALLQTLEWLRALLWQARLEGVLRSGIGFGLSRDAWPLWGSLHLPGLLLLAARVPGWSRRVLAGDAAPAAFAGVVVLGTLAGFPRELPLLLLLPWAASEAGAMAAAVAGTRASRGATALRALVLAAAVGALAATTIGRAAGNSGEPPSTAEIESWLAERLPAGSLVAHDLGFAPSGGGELRFLPIPFHAVDPASERGAYWTGWYGACRGVVLSERMIVRFLRRAEEFPDVVAFYLDLRDQAVEERASGSRPGGRVRALLLPEGRGPLDEGWRERVALGPAGGLRGGFLATLGGELARGGALAEAIELLDAALAAGYADVGIHINLANAELALGRPLDAGRRLDDALLLYPDSPEVLYNLAIVMTRVGYWERAVETLSRLRPLWPRSAPAAYLLGISLANSGQPGAAERVLEEVLAIDPRFPRREEVERHLATLRAGRRP